jgi:glycosyltransferase involved in cell wall biosynthesis
MPGFVERPSDWLSAFDVFVSPARNEPFGLVLLEAMRSRLPVIASASEGARHLAAVIGRPLLPIGDANALAAALRPLLEAPPPRQAYALERFGADARMAEIEAWYARLTPAA